MSDQATAVIPDRQAPMKLSAFDRLDQLDMQMGELRVVADDLIGALSVVRRFPTTTGKVEAEADRAVDPDNCSTLGGRIVAQITLLAELTEQLRLVKNSLDL